MMAEQYLEESRSARTVNNNGGYQYNAMTDEEFDEHISQLPIAAVPNTQKNYLMEYAQNGMPILNLVQAIRAIPAERQTAIISQLRNIAISSTGENSQIALLTSRTLTRAQTLAGRVAPIGIVAVQLSWEALKSIRLWWNGDITGKRCVKQIIDASAGILGCYVGGTVGITIGSALLLGYGTLIGSVVGGIAGSFGASTLSEWLTRYFFGLPRSVALEHAYNFLDLSPSCSNDEVNKKYRALALQYHPDKGGRAEDFHTLQISVAIIKQARGQGV